MNINSNRLILLDVGGTFIKAALGEPFKGATEGTFTSTPISSDGTREEIGNAFREAVGGQMKHAAENGFTIEAVCVAIPGPFDYNEGIFLMKHKFASVYGVSFREILAEVIPADMRLAFVHDVNGVLLGALNADPTLKEGIVGISTLGTGLGFSYAVKGEIQESPTGSPARSLWNQPYGEGILEDYVSRRGILKTYSSLGGVLAEGEDVKEIADLARKGDETALETFRATGRHYAAGAKAVIAEFGITHVFFAGQIAKSFDLMEEEVSKGLGEGVTVSVLDDIQGTVLIGAASL